LPWHENQSISRLSQTLVKFLTERVASPEVTRSLPIYDESPIPRVRVGSIYGSALFSTFLTKRVQNISLNAYNTSASPLQGGDTSFTRNEYKHLSICSLGHAFFGAFSRFLLKHRLSVSTVIVARSSRELLLHDDEKPLR